MADRPQEKPPTRTFRKFIPCLSALENRLSPSAAGHASFLGPQVSNDHGVAIQTGPLLGVTVNRPGRNTVRVGYDGSGHAQVKWNGGHSSTYTGVAIVDIHAQGGRKNKFTFALVGSASAAAPLAAGAGGHAETAAAPRGRASLRMLARAASQNHGNAVQSGAILTVDVADARGNSVQLSDAGAGGIQVAWNGGPPHSFTGISSIIIHALRARNDQIIFTGPVV
jgi:hypothetical protein